MIKVNQVYFLDKEAEYYQDEAGELWMTAEQIGKLLGYKNPRNSVMNFFKRHRSELIDDTRRVKLDTGNGKYETTLFNVAAIMIIGIKSNSKLNDDFTLWAAKMLADIRKELNIEHPLLLESTGIGLSDYPLINQDVNMKEKAIVKYFEDKPVEFFQDEQGKIWVTAEQIGNALEYSNPKKAISNIYNRNQKRLNRHQKILTMRTPGGKQKVRVFDKRAVYFIIMRSDTKLAYDFQYWFSGILEELEEGKLANIDSLKEELSQNRQILEQLVLEVSALKLNYLTPSMIEELPPMDRYHLFNKSMWLLLDRLFPLKEANNGV